jgi:hypothetical protein
MERHPPPLPFLVAVPSPRLGGAYCCLTVHHTTTVAHLVIHRRPRPAQLLWGSSEAKPPPVPVTAKIVAEDDAVHAGLAVFRPLGTGPAKI